MTTSWDQVDPLVQPAIRQGEQTSAADRHRGVDLQIDDRFVEIPGGRPNHGRLRAARQASWNTNTRSGDWVF